MIVGVFTGPIIMSWICQFGSTLDQGDSAWYEWGIIPLNWHFWNLMKFKYEIILNNFYLSAQLIKLFKIMYSPKLQKCAATPWQLSPHRCAAPHATHHRYYRTGVPTPLANLNLPPNIPRKTSSQPIIHNTHLHQPGLGLEPLIAGTKVDTQSHTYHSASNNPAKVIQTN